MHGKSRQLCVTLCNPRDCSQQGSALHGNIQARILEWVVMPSSRGSSLPRYWNQSPEAPALQADSLLLNYQGIHSPATSSRYRLIDWLTDYILCSPRWRRSIQSAKTRLGAECGSDHELLLQNSDLKKLGKVTKQFRYDLIQIPYNYTVEVTNRFKGLDLIECLKNYRQGFTTLYRRQWSKPSLRKRNAKRQNGCLRSIYK